MNQVIMKERIIIQKIWKQCFIVLPDGNDAFSDMN